MNKFVAAILWLLGGLTVGAAAISGMTVPSEATSQEPVPVFIWTIEDVAISGHDHALAVDSFDRPHLIYVDPVDGVLSYAVREFPGWRYEDVANESLDLPFLAYDLQIRPGDIETPCLVYATEQSQPGTPIDTKLVYGCRGPDGWDLTTLDDGGRAAQLLFDSAGRPHIALIQGLNVVYLWREGDQWRREIAALDSDYLNELFFLLDGTGWPSIVYRGAHGQFQAVRDWDHSWTSSPLSWPTVYAARLDFADQLWLAVNDGEAAWGHPPFYLARLKLIEPTDGGAADWEIIDEAYDWQIAVDLALDGADFPNLAYLDPDGALQYVWWSEEGQHSHAPNARGQGQVSLVLNYDQTWIAFTDSNQLKVAARRVVWFDHALYLPGVLGMP